MMDTESLLTPAALAKYLDVPSRASTSGATGTSARGVFEWVATSNT